MTGADIPEPSVLPLYEIARRVRQRAWIYLVVAYLLSVPIVAAWIYHFRHLPRTEEAISLAHAGLAILTVLAGLPALLLLSKAVTRSHHARRSTSKTRSDWAIILSVAILLALATAGGIIVEIKMHA